MNLATAKRPDNDLDQLRDLIKQAQKAGAVSADAMLIDGISRNVSWRGGKLESLEQTEAGDLGLRVLIGKQQAIVSSSDRRPAALKELVERAVAMAKAAPEDPFCGLAEPADLATSWPTLELADTYDVSAEKLLAQVKAAEAAALSVSGVSQCESTDASASSSTSALVTSNGFAGQYRRSNYSLSATVLAGSGTAMERDYDYAMSVRQRDLPDATAIGLSAAQRTVRRLHARKMPTAQVPVVFEPRIAGGLLSHLAGAISGTSIARGTSFLKDKMGQTIFAPTINIIDDPLRSLGLRSRLFDGEGLSPSRRSIIENGVLTSWMLDLRSARQLGLKSTGHASRSASSLPHPSPSNLYLAAGNLTPAELIKDIKNGFYVTDLMGSGVNSITGDYSRAAAGFWIENGQISIPVNEMTIAGNLKDMFLELTAADDLAFRYGIDSPTLRIESMTVAGL